MGGATANVVRREIGTAWEGSEVRKMESGGRHIADGVPRGQVLTSKEVHAALSECLTGIVTAIKTALEQTPPELGADVAEKGLVVSGGGALLRDIDRMLGEQTPLPLLLMPLVHRGHPLGRIRAGLGVAVYPIQFVAALPSAAASWVSGLFTTRNDLAKKKTAPDPQPHAPVC